MARELYNDQELIQELATGSQAAFEVIFNKYWEPLYAQAYNRLRSKEIAEELIQDIFTDLWERRLRLEVYKSLPSYLFTALKYRIFNHIRAQVVRKKHKEESIYHAISKSHITEEQLSFHELYTILEKEINQLPEKCRLVFNLTREGHTAKEIAEQLDISHRTVETHIRNARQTLKAKLPGYTTIVIILSTPW